MEQMREILKRIHDDGNVNFKPNDDSSAAIKEFQAIAKRLHAAHEKGYLVNAHFRVSNMRETAGYTLEAIVNGGLTFDGEQFLYGSPIYDKNPVLSNSEKSVDIIEIRPGIFGLRLNGNELYRRLKRWWKDGVKGRK